MSTPAAADNWTGATSTDWFITGNWSTGAVPTSADSVVIDTTTPNATAVTGANASALDIEVGSAGTGTLTISSGGTLTDIVATVGRLSGSNGTVTVTGATTKWINGSLSVGSSGTGRLTIQNGGTGTAVDASIGNFTGATGTVEVDGVGSSFTVTNGLVVGFSGGTGVLSIQNGGIVTDKDGTVGSQPGSIGLAIANGPGSTWVNSNDLAIGLHAKGTLLIAAGGAVTSVNGHLGLYSGGDGTATIGGAGSTWTNSADLFVGEGADGTGTLNVLNGGAVSNGFGYVAYDVGSAGSVTVDGAGSTWTNSSDLHVGDKGTGTLTISNGGAVSTAIGFLGDGYGATGTVTVDGAGSAWTSSSDLYIGLNGAGTLNILNGGAVSNALGTIGLSSISVSAVTVDGAGSSWVNSAGLYVGYFGTGTLTISNGGTVSVGVGLRVAGLAGSFGTINIGGAAGAAALAPGTLNVGTVQFGLGTGALNFNHTSAGYTFAPAISGFGTINQVAGTTILTADSSAFTGATNVTGGRLAVNGSLANSIVTVSGGGILGGIGTVGGIVGQSGGIIGPGNSIGALTVNGNLTQAAGSVYQVELTSTGQSDLIHATGAADISAGAILDVVKTDAGAYVLGTHYTVLQADSGVTGTYFLSGGGPFVGLLANYDATHVYLDVVQAKSFAAVGLTPNQIAAGGAAEGLGSGNAIFDAIFALPTEAAAQAAFDQLSGEVHASAKGVMIEDSRFLREAALDRLRTAFDTPAPDGLSIWSRGFGAWGSVQGDGNAAGVNRDIGGLFVGADSLFADTWRLGLVGGYSRSTFDIGDRNASGSSDNYHIGLYAGTTWGDLAIRSGVAYTWHDISTSRSIAIPGFADTLTGDYGAGTTQAFGELGYRIKAGQTAIGNLAFEPFANLAYVNLSTEGFTEKGGAAALTSQGDDTGVAFSTLGLRASTSFTIGTVAATAKGTLGWRHAYGDTTPLSTLAFAGGAAFNIAGVPIAKDTLVVEGGLDFNLTPKATLGLSYGGQFGSGLTDQSARGNLNVRF